MKTALGCAVCREVILRERCTELEIAHRVRSIDVRAAEEEGIVGRCIRCRCSRSIVEALARLARWSVVVYTVEVERWSIRAALARLRMP